MFTFCFTTLAAANLRRQTVRNSTRSSAARAIRRGVTTLLVLLATTGVTYAGGPSKSHKSLSGGSNKFSSSLGISSAPKFKAMKIEPRTNTLKLDFKKTKTPTFIKSDNKSLGLGISKTPKLADSFPLNQKIVDIGKNDKGKNDTAKNLKKKKDFNWWWLYSGLVRRDCYRPCDRWVCYDYPTWCPLYQHHCGNYYDVPVCYVGRGVDLQLLAIRRVDAGDLAQGFGPTYRVWFRNNSSISLYRSFNVLLMAAPGAQASANLPQAGVQIDSIEAGQTMAVDIRLPSQAGSPALPMLHVLVDSHRNVKEVHENNNGIVLAASSILNVDPAPIAVANAIPAGL